MDNEHKGEIRINGKLLPVTSFSFSPPLEPHLMYNRQFLPANQVPECETSLCKEKAVQKCVLCLTPTCNGHASMAVKEFICQYCRLACWIYEQRKGKS